ncbi:hypothetical protein AS030_15275 [Fictibacillus enclensis]|uniref:Uncharacterized protein n=1 Tax=Fictibacillus enclensis TaxID=1017270 RepID=A0A0V8J7A0_9BACL|nr:hypothetical protein AS030_15275 [Fictibacillus enclensis]
MVTSKVFEYRSCNTWWNEQVIKKSLKYKKTLFFYMLFQIIFLLFINDYQPMASSYSAILIGLGGMKMKRLEDV